MPGFWVEPEDVSGETLVLRGGEAHHLVRVRRHRVGERIDAVDGEGRYFEAVITAVERDEVVCRILARWEGRGESPVRLCLAPALVKGQRFDFVVEKATEIGVDSIAPLLVKRSVVRTGAGGKVERWERLVRAAVKQCGRSRLPQIHSPAPLAAVVERLQRQGRTILMASPGGDFELRDLLARERTPALGLLIGPEGGFAPEEEEWIRKNGGYCFSWGERILRADTASVVLGALVLHEAESALTAR